MRHLPAILPAIVLAMTACSAPKAYHTSDGYMLGTSFHIVASTEFGADSIYSIAMHIDAEAKASMSLFDPESRLSRINANRTDTLDGHLLRNLTLARRIWTVSDGAYDVTVAPLTRAYGFAGSDRNHAIDVDSILRFVGFDKVDIDGPRISKRDPRVAIDLNSIAKGYTVDLISEALEARGCMDYIVEVGGEIRARGLSPRGTRWRVAVDSPFDGNDAPGMYEQTIVSLDGGALATSGNYRRFYTDESGNKITHTIDPHTGLSVRSRLLSASVHCPTCMEADALATMFMALGDERACRMAEEMRDSVQVYLILSPVAGDEYEIYSTLRQ